MLCRYVKRSQLYVYCETTKHNIFDNTSQFNHFTLFKLVANIYYNGDFCFVLFYITHIFKRHLCMNSGTFKAESGSPPPAPRAPRDKGTGSLPR